MTELYTPDDDRYVTNPNYEPPFDPEGDEGAMDPERHAEYRAALKRYQERCARYAH